MGNPFEGVSWNKPFGNSTASTLVGGQGGLSSVFDNVSMTDPLGQGSWLAEATGHGNKDSPLTSEGKDKKTGEQVIIPGTGGSSLSNEPQFGGTFVTPPTTSAPTTSPRAPRMGALAGVRPSFQANYLNALNPNSGFKLQNVPQNKQSIGNSIRS